MTDCRKITFRQPHRRCMMSQAIGPLTLFMICVVAGCIGGETGPERAAVQGRVTLNGTPITEGTISFLPTGSGGGPTSGGIIENGAYSIPLATGPIVGEHRVEIRSLKKTGKQIPVMPPAVSATGSVDEMIEAVPAKFNSGSKLTQIVESGKNTIDFDLKSE